MPDDFDLVVLGGGPGGYAAAPYGASAALEADGRSISIADGTMIRGRNVLIATGSLPRELPVDGLAFDGDRVLSSEEVLLLQEVPAKVAVIGGGAIGCEFASFLVDAGSEVTLLEALPQILAGVDQQVAQTVVRAFQKRGIKTHTDVRVLGFDGNAVRFEAKSGEQELPV